MFKLSHVMLMSCTRIPYTSVDPQIFKHSYSHSCKSINLHLSGSYCLKKIKNGVSGYQSVKMYRAK